MQHIKHILWDMDGVLFHYHDAFVAASYDAYVAVAMEMVSGMDANTAMRLAKQSYETTRAPMKVFIDDYKLDPLEFMAAFNRVIDLSSLTPNVALKEKIQNSKTTHSILTIASQAWALRLTQHLQLSDIFSAENIFAQEQCNHIHKSQSTEPFLIALNTNDQRAEDTVMIEDTQRNLKHAKALGMTTVLVYPKPNEKIEDFVDYVFDTPTAFLDELAKHHP